MGVSQPFQHGLLQRHGDTWRIKTFSYYSFLIGSKARDSRGCTPGILLSDVCGATFHKHRNGLEEWKFDRQWDNTRYIIMQLTLINQRLAKQHRTIFSSVSHFFTCYYANVFCTSLISNATQLYFLPGLVGAFVSAWPPQAHQEKADMQMGRGCKVGGTSPKGI